MLISWPARRSRTEEVVTDDDEPELPPAAEHAQE
jgi:hypothetical protein